MPETPCRFLKNPAATDFGSMDRHGIRQIRPVTAFAVLVEIAGSSVTPLCSTYFNVIGDESRLGEITSCPPGAAGTWDGAAFSRASTSVAVR